MLPKGFKVGGMHVGISNKKASKLDLSLFISECPASVAGVFTRNIVKAAPIIVSIKRLQHIKKCYGIVANSGCANACTGIRGIKTAEYICAVVENSLKLKSETILCASTGIIGKQITLNKKIFEKNISDIVNNGLGRSAKNEENAVFGIMTTDTFIKKISKSIVIDNRKVVIWGCVKGSGMIHPDLIGFHATMLSFILTDLNINNTTLQTILNESIDSSFNNISIDGDTSTNDSIIVLANGKSNVTLSSQIDIKNFIDAFNEVTIELAKLIVKDGEGATKFVELEVKNTKTKNDAKKIASTVATSPLFKTALFGSDLNWGRIIAAIGRSGVNFNINKIDIYVADLQILKNGKVVKFSNNTAKTLLLKKEIKFIIDFKEGSASIKYYTCDFSYNYVKINSEYN
ncbi:MAG: bifunctional glutamate N-acetyltransferase/amino-acid acetyltransferase ArgJ [Endomicrobium sp.]|nr:bifunctional glutamate N-acetyltransferase/amino-acid acetyltransferase ArgJ [Endomicrobium sp.]